jgi:peptide/nickel transport system permease protein
MTANPAIPDPAAAPTGPFPAAPTAPSQAGLTAAMADATTALPGTPARGSRGRHAGPAIAQPTGAELRAAAAGRVRQALSVLRAHPLATAGGLIIVAMIVFCFVGPALYHTDQIHVFLSQENLSPRAGHPLGTDNDGNDELGRLMQGGQVSLEVGAAAGLLAALLGSLWGATAGYLGGAVDAVMMRIVDAGIAIPTIVLLLVLVSLYRPSTTMLILVIAGTSWLSTARLVRAEALTLRSREYVQAARVMGGGSVRAIVRHIAPNAIGTIVVNVTFQIASAILLLAALSFLQLGVPYPAVDWGDMLGAAAQTIDDGFWWQILAPGLAILLVVVALTMLGDGLRDGLARDE